MKKLLMTIGVVTAMGLASCAPYSGGALYSNYKAPLDVRDNGSDCAKQGESEMTNILGYFATGDASVAKAKEDGGITKVSSVDYNFQSILGIVSTTTTLVCGE